MRYIIRQKIFSFGDSFKIKDEAGNEIFMVKSQLLSFGHKLRIYDMAGNELCYIEQQLLRFMPEYDIYVGGGLTANIKKKFTFFKKEFIISGSGGEYYIDGDFWAHEFDIVKNGIVVARISKSFFSFSDTYGVDIDDREDQVTNLAMAIVIDLVCHHDNN
ncbi:MAG: LURP-one-related family protein [Clostridia bacterium]|nr:LURP-one-related family protein [Clostridia bacterium]